MATLFNWISKPKGILFLSGRAGNGKTYIAEAWKNHLIEQKKNVRFFHQLSLISEVKKAIQKNHDTLTEMERLCETPYFILDDFGHGSLTEFNKDHLIHFIETRYNAFLPTMITSNLWKKEIQEMFSERIVSRIFDASNVAIRLELEDRRQWDRERSINITNF